MSVQKSLERILKANEGVCWNPHCGHDSTCQEDRKEVTKQIKQELEKQEHDHEILVNTIIDTKDQEIEKVREEGYADGWREAEKIGIEQVRIAERKT